MHGRTFEPEIGLYFYRARYLHPELGRFLQGDPNGYEDSLNMYQAFNQNPVNFVDPMGFQCMKEFEKLEKQDKIFDIANEIIKASKNKRTKPYQIENLLSAYYDLHKQTGLNPLNLDKDTIEGLSKRQIVGVTDREQLERFFNTLFRTYAELYITGLAAEFGPAIAAHLEYRIAGIFLRLRARFASFSSELALLNRVKMVEPMGAVAKSGSAAGAGSKIALELERIGFEETSIQQIIKARSTGKPIVLIGEYQPRVDRMAKALEKIGLNIKTYQPRNIVKGVSRKALEADRGWLRYWTKRKGGLVIDIGYNPLRSKAGDFYKVEFNSIYKNWKYQDVIKINPGY
jgi:RHS repeat-associated protein